MADKASILTGGTNSFQTTAEHVNYPATDFISNGVVGAITNTSGVAPSTGGLACNAQGSPNMTVAVTAGVAYFLVTPTGQASQRLRANIAAQNATIASNATGGTRFDWIYVTASATNANTPNAAGDNVMSITVSRSTSASVDNGTPPSYGYNLAVVTVANAAASITNGNIADKRSRTGSSSTPASGLRPNTINFTATSGSNFLTTSAAYTDVTGVSTTYTAGPTNERLFIWIAAMFELNSGANAQITLNAGSDLSPALFTNGTTVTRQSQLYVVDVVANSVTTLKMRAKTDANTLTINFNNADFVPTIGGFAVSNV